MAEGSVFLESSLKFQNQCICFLHSYAVLVDIGVQDEFVVFSEIVCSEEACCPDRFPLIIYDFVDVVIKLFYYS